MISALRKLEVELQAIEQPLDLSVPENKMMLAFYLAAPEWKTTVEPELAQRHVLILVITLVTISFRAMRAALANPIGSLRTE